MPGLEDEIEKKKSRKSQLAAKQSNSQSLRTKANQKKVKAYEKPIGRKSQSVRKNRKIRRSNVLSGLQIL